MSLRSRLAVLFGLVALVASALVGAISYRSTASELRDSTDRFLEQRAEETAEALRDFAVAANVGSPRVSYRQTVRKRGKGEGVFDQETANKRQFGKVVVSVEPLAEPEGFELEWDSAAQFAIPPAFHAIVAYSRRRPRVSNVSRLWSPFTVPALSMACQA